MKRWVILVTIPFLFLGTTAPAAADHVDLAELYQILPWDSLHTITNPKFNDHPYVAPSEIVFGVSIGDESHTYPEKLMNYHEVIDDVVGGVPVVVAYCPLCGVAIAYERTVSGTVLTFRTSGYLYRNNKVLFDVQTGSLWPMILGEAINGTYHGTRLRIVTTSRLPFTEWTGLHPDAKVVARPWGPVLCPLPCPIPFGFDGYDVNPYADYQAGNRTYAPVKNPDERLHPKTYVVGLEFGGDAWAVAFPDLLARRAINATVGGFPLVVALWVNSSQGAFPTTSAHVYRRGPATTFTVDPVANALVDEPGNRYAIQTGVGANGELEPVQFFYGFWFAWHDHHPETRLFGFEPPAPSPFLDATSAAILAVVGGSVVAAVVLRWRLRGRGRSG